jgi:hypothetical protein
LLKGFFYKYGYETGGNSGSNAARVAMVKTIEKEIIDQKRVTFKDYEEFFPNARGSLSFRKDEFKDCYSIEGLCRELTDKGIMTKNKRKTLNDLNCLLQKSDLHTLIPRAYQKKIQTAAGLRKLRDILSSFRRSKLALSTRGTSRHGIFLKNV